MLNQILPNQLVFANKASKRATLKAAKQKNIQTNKQPKEIFISLIQALAKLNLQVGDCYEFGMANLRHAHQAWIERTLAVGFCVLLMTKERLEVI